MSTPGSPKSNRRTTAQEDSTPLRPAKKQKPPDPTLDGKTTKLLLGSAVIGQKIDDNAQLSIKKSGDYKVTGKPFNWRGVVTAIEKLGDNGLMKITLTPITLATNSEEYDSDLTQKKVRDLNNHYDDTKEKAETLIEEIKTKLGDNYTNWQTCINEDGSVDSLYTTKNMKDNFAVEQVSRYGFQSLTPADLVGHICCLSLSMASYVANRNWPAVRTWVQAVERLYELEDYTCATTGKAEPETELDPDAALFSKKWQ